MVHTDRQDVSSLLLHLTRRDGEVGAQIADDLLVCSQRSKTLLLALPLVTDAVQGAKESFDGLVAEALQGLHVRVDEHRVDSGKSQVLDLHLGPRKDHSFVLSDPPCDGKEPILAE